MTDFVLHFAPGSCSRVPLIALIETGVPFETRLMRFGKGESRSPEYRKLNPKGKIPLLLVGGEPLTENVAIQTYLNARFPEARLLPSVATPLEAARQIADLCFCSATLHPNVTRIRMPVRFVAPEGARSVRDKAIDSMREHFALIEERLAHGPWWYGPDWSIMDAYLGWVFGRVEDAEFPVRDYPRFVDHNARLGERPSFQRAIAIEADAEATLDSEGLAFRPPPVPA